MNKYRTFFPVALVALSFWAFHCGDGGLTSGNQVTITVTAEHGTVSLDPELHSYTAGEQVMLTAVADSGYCFIGWAGDISGSSNPVTIVVKVDRHVTALFGIDNSWDYSGAWSGKTSAGKKVSFNVRGERITSVTYTIGTATGYISAFGDTGISIVADTFQYKTSTVTFKGRFMADSCSGTVANMSISSGSYSFFTTSAVTMLERLNIAGVTMTPSFNGHITEYAMTVVADTVEVHAMAKDSRSMVSVNGISADTNDIKAHVAIPIGPSTVRIEVMASDGIRRREYRIEATRGVPLSLMASNGGITAIPDQPLYGSTDTVMLLAIPTDGYRFDAWSGDTLKCSADTAWVVMDKRKSVTALFRPAGLVAVYRFNGGTVTCLAFTPDGNRFAVGTGMVVVVRDVYSGDSLLAFIDHTRNVTSAAFSPDGGRAVSGSADKTVQVWDANSGRMLKRLVGHQNTVTAVAFCDDGNSIISTANEPIVRIWDASSGNSIDELTCPVQGVYVTSLAISVDGSLAVTGDNNRTVRLWDLRNRMELWNRTTGYCDDVTAVSINHDASRILAGAKLRTASMYYSGPVAWVWNAIGDSVGSVPSMPNESGTSCVVFSPDGTRFLTTSSYLSVSTYYRAVYLWDAVTFERLVELPHGSDVTAAVFSPDGSHVLTGSGDGTVSLWRLQ